MSENGIESKNKTRKKSFRKIIGVILPVLLLAAFAIFICILRMIYPPADETIIRIEAARVLYETQEDLTDDEINIREETAKIVQKDPNDLTDKDFTKIKKITLKGSTCNIKLLEKFTNLEELNLHVKIRKNKIPQWLKYISQRYQIKLPERKYIDLSPLEKLSHLKKLDLYGGDFDDITPVSNIRSMEDLNISGTHIYDINSLQKLTNLKKLNLFGGSYKNITPIANLFNLEELNLQSTRITNIAQLRNLKKLKILYIHETQVSDLEPVKDLISLERLYISRTKITNFEPLKELTKLKRLAIDGNQMACVEFIKDLPNLQILDLVGYNPIDLEPLKQLTNLNIIQINSEYIKAEQIDELEKALPKTEIRHLFIH